MHGQWNILQYYYYYYCFVVFVVVVVVVVHEYEVQCSAEILL